MDPNASTVVTSLHPGMPSGAGAGGGAAARTDQLLEMLVNCSIGKISNLTRAIDISLDGISDWIAKPKNRRKIANLVALLDAQTQLLICQHRVGAVARLAEVAGKDAKPEVVRRACTDLLKLRLIDPYKEDRRPDKMPPAEPKTREEIRAKMLRDEEDHQWMMDLMTGRLPGAGLPGGSNCGQKGAKNGSI